jgi:hypothetical protein
VAQPHADPADALHVPDPGSQLGAEESGIRCLVRHTANGRQAEVDGGRRVVENGRLQLNEPTDLPDGTELELVVDDEGDDPTEQERQALHEALSRAWTSAQAAEMRPASAIIDELRRRR